MHKDFQTGYLRALISVTVYRLYVQHIFSGCQIRKCQAVHAGRQGKPLVIEPVQPVHISGLLRQIEIVGGKFYRKDILSVIQLEFPEDVQVFRKHHVTSVFLACLYFLIEQIQCGEHHFRQHLVIVYSVRIEHIQPIKATGHDHAVIQSLYRPQIEIAVLKTVLVIVYMRFERIFPLAVL